MFQKNFLKKSAKTYNLKYRLIKIAELIYDLMNRIELRYIREEDKLFQFRTFVDIEQGDYYQQGDGMLFIGISYQDLLPYFAE